MLAAHPLSKPEGPQTGGLKDFSCTTISRVYREQNKNNRIYIVNRSSLGENALLKPEVRGERLDWFQLTERQHCPLVTTNLCRKQTIFEHMSNIKEELTLFRLKK